VAGEVRRDDDRITRVLQGVEALDKEDGLLRRTCAGLGSVLGVVEPDAEELCGRDGGEKLAGTDGFVADAEVAVNIAQERACGAVGLECGVSDSAVRELMADEFHRGKKSNFSEGRGVREGKSRLAKNTSKILSARPRFT